jgi:hypothetical protein
MPHWNHQVLTLVFIPLGNDPEGMVTMGDASHRSKRCWYRWGQDQIWTDIACNIPIVGAQLYLFYKLQGLGARSEATVDSGGSAVGVVGGGVQFMSSGGTAGVGREEGVEGDGVGREEGVESDAARTAATGGAVSSTQAQAEAHAQGLSVNGMLGLDDIPPPETSFGLEGLPFRIKVMLAMSITTLFITNFVAANFAYLSTSGHNNIGYGNGGVGRALLFISIFLVDGQGFILALIFGGEASAMCKYRQYYERALGCFRRTLYDIEDIEALQSGRHSSVGLVGINADADHVCGAGTIGSATERVAGESARVGQGLVALARMMSSDDTLVQTLRRRRVLYEHSFRGSDAVTWLVNGRRVLTRAEGETLGMKLLAGGLLYHVDRELLFYDSDDFYCFDALALEAGYTHRTTGMSGMVGDRAHSEGWVTRSVHATASACVTAPLPSASEPTPRLHEFARPSLQGRRRPTDRVTAQSQYVTR